MRKLAIIVEENGEMDGKGFNFYLTGDIERVVEKIPEDAMSPAEFWGSKFFTICQGILIQSGAAKHAGQPKEIH